MVVCRVLLVFWCCQFLPSLLGVLRLLQGLGAAAAEDVAGWGEPNWNVGYAGFTYFSTA